MKVSGGLFAIYSGWCCVALGQVAPTISFHYIFAGVTL